MSSPRRSRTKRRNRRQQSPFGRRKFAIIGITLIAVAIMIALVFYTSQTLTVTTPSSVYVIIQKGAGENLNLGFDPAKISIVIGINNTVVWKNEDSNWHTAHSNIPEFNSGLIQPGASFTHTFLRAGVYPYHCDPHPWMTGVVTVKAASGTGMIVHWGPNLREPLLEPSTIIMSINPASCELARGQNMAVT